MTAAQLTLERFNPYASAGTALPPCYGPEDLEAAHAAGVAEGRAAAETAALAMLAAVVGDLAAALREDEERRQSIMADASRALAKLVSTVVSVIAPSFRSEALSEAIIVMLSEHIASTGTTPPVLGCEIGMQLSLRATLDAAGLHDVRIATIAAGAELSSPGGVLRIDPDRLRRQLDHIIADIRESAA